MLVKDMQIALLVEGCPTCETYLEKNDSFIQKVPLHNPTINVMKAPQLRCSSILSYKQDGPINFIYITHYLQQKKPYWNSQWF
jgi:hypothetical protein